MPGEVLLAPGMNEGGEPLGLPAGAAAEQDSIPGIVGSRKAADNKHYVQNPDGSYMEVVKPNAVDIPQSLKDTALHKGFPLFSNGYMLVPVQGNPFENKQ